MQATIPATRNGHAANLDTLPTVFTASQVDFLHQRTPPEAIRTRPGRSGQQLSYISQAYVTRTLNEVFGFDWDFDVLWQEVGKGEVIVRGRLTVRTTTGVTIAKTQYGGSAIKRDKQGNAFSVADDLKSAASDALKKCSSLLGIGLDLYERRSVSAGRTSWR